MLANIKIESAKILVIRIYSYNAINELIKTLVMILRRSRYKKRAYGTFIDYNE